MLEIEKMKSEFYNKKKQMAQKELQMKESAEIAAELIIPEDPANILAPKPPQELSGVPEEKQ